MAELIADVTFDILDRFDEQAERERLAVLTRDEMLKMGRSYKAQLALLDNVELRCRIRASRLQHLGYTNKEIAEAFDVDVKTVRGWVRKVKPSVIV